MTCRWCQANAVVNDLLLVSLQDITQHAAAVLSAIQQPAGGFLAGYGTT